MSTTHKMQALVRGVGDAMLCKMLHETSTRRANKTFPQEKQIAIAVTRSWLIDECARRFDKDLVRQWFEAELEAGKPIDPAEFILPPRSNQAA